VQAAADALSLIFPQHEQRPDISRGIVGDEKGADFPVAFVDPSARVSSIAR